MIGITSEKEWKGTREDGTRDLAAEAWMNLKTFKKPEMIPNHVMKEKNAKFSFSNPHFSQKLRFRR